MESKATKKDIFWTWFVWSIINHTCYNYERLQAPAVCCSMAKLSKKLYPDDPEGRKDMLRREIMFFNTEIQLGSVIVGLATGMEVAKANGEDIDPELIINLKSGLMGPMAGIGDTISQGIVIPLVLSIGMSMVLDGNAILGPVMAFIVLTCYHFGMCYASWYFGYNKGSEAILNLLESGLVDRLIEGAGIVGCMVMGSLIANYVKVTTKLAINTAYSSFDVQTGLFDQITPDGTLLPLLLTFGVMALMNKGWSSLKCIAVLFVGALVLTLIGVI